MKRSRTDLMISYRGRNGTGAGNGACAGTSTFAAASVKWRQDPANQEDRNGNQKCIIGYRLRYYQQTAGYREDRKSLLQGNPMWENPP